MLWLLAARTLHTRSRGVSEPACSSRYPSSMRVFARADVGRSARTSAGGGSFQDDFCERVENSQVLRSRAVSHGLGIHLRISPQYIQTRRSVIIEPAWVPRLAPAARLSATGTLPDESDWCATRWRDSASDSRRRTPSYAGTTSTPSVGDGAPSTLAVIGRRSR